MWNIEETALKTLTFQELNAVNAALRPGYTVYYWGTSNNVEADFEVYGDKGVRAFEIKRTGKVSQPMLRGLRSFLKDYSEARTYLIYGEKRRMRQDAVEVIPAEDFLKGLPAILS